MGGNGTLKLLSTKDEFVIRCLYIGMCLSEGNMGEISPLVPPTVQKGAVGERCLGER